MESREGIKARKHLSTNALIRVVQERFSFVKDPRRGLVEIPLSDALMSAFAMFSLKCPSLLAFEEERKNPNIGRFYHIGRTPSDTRMREILDSVAPEEIRPAFADVFRCVQRGKILERFAYWKNCYLLACDGTGYFSSDKVHCTSCLEKHSQSGRITYSHAAVAAVIVHPDIREVIPLCPEPIIRQDGTEKNDCERNASRRLLSHVRKDHPHLGFIVTEDGLASNGPHIQDLRAHDMHFILGAKPGDHALLFEQATQAIDDGTAITWQTDDPHKSERKSYTAVAQLPLNAAHPDLMVNFVSCTVEKGKKSTTFSWVTDLPVEPREMMLPLIERGGRARWRIENETFNTLKNQDYHFEHNYGHGFQHLSTVLMMLMMLAFLVDQTSQLACPLFRAAYAAMKSKRALWERLRALFFTAPFEDMEQLYRRIIRGFEDFPTPVNSS
ncbi:transposase [Schlesneria sp. T3-172]|uniref:transposase n=1 Tax=Schlesneria sphaerica TaxID=3373610 RepID=UPI0037C58739